MQIALETPDDAVVAAMVAGVDAGDYRYGDLRELLPGLLADEVIAHAQVSGRMSCQIIDGHRCVALSLGAQEYQDGRRSLHSPSTWIVLVPTDLPARIEDGVHLTLFDSTQCLTLPDRIVLGTRALLPA